MFSILCVLFGIINLSVAQELISKCDEYFEYDLSKNEDGRWYGNILLNSEYILIGYWVELELSEKIELLGSKEQVTSKDNKRFLFLNPEGKIEPGTTKKIPIFVKYDILNAIPEVSYIHINGREVCPTQIPAPVGLSPCPGIFTYDNNQPEASGRWFGTINLNVEYKLRGVFVEFHLSSKADLVGNGNYRVNQINNQVMFLWTPFGEIESKNNTSYTINNSSFVLSSGEMLSIPFFVKYDILLDIPLVNTVLLNGRVICQDSLKDLQIKPHIPLLFNNASLITLPPRSQASSQIVETGVSTTSIPKAVATTTTIKATTSTSLRADFIPELDSDYGSIEDDDYQCGVQEIADKIINAETTSITKHPWHGAIFKRNEYICGMTLISRKHAISAAHCFYENTKLPTDFNGLTFRFGVDNIQMLRTRKIQQGKLNHVHVHPNYKYHLTRYDIAVMAFDNKLLVTDFVKPVCLWSGDSSLHQIENKTGLIVGFGQTEAGVKSNNLREARILVVDSETCRDVDPAFYALQLTINSFCAGNISGASACAGDSGSGLYFKKPGTEIWQIRGVTSTGKADTFTCNNRVYVIYTDVAKFKDWILGKML